MKRYITDHQFSLLKLQLFSKLIGRADEFDLILGIRNGGLNVSRPLSSYFLKPHQEIYISFYQGDLRLPEPSVIGDLNHYKEKRTFRKLLWVDDIVDSGSTLRWFMDKTGLVKGKDFEVAVIHWCEEASPDLMPEYYVEKKQKTDWVVYPWEV